MPSWWEPRWSASHAALFAALVLSLALVRWLLGRALREHDGARSALWRAALALAAGAAVVIALDGGGLVRASVVLDALNAAGNHTLITISGVNVTAVTVLVFIALLGVTWWGSGYARDRLETSLARREVGDPGTRASVARLVQYAVAALGASIALQSIGIDLQALVTAGAVFAVGIGFAMQNIAQNFVSGVILLAERSISPGDIVVVDGQIVRIRILGIRATIARTLDDEEIIIPNSFLVQSNVKNLTLDDSAMRVRLPIGVHYASDLDVVLRALTRAAERVEGRLPNPPVVALTGFGASSVDFEVSIWIGDPWTRQRMRSALALSVWHALKDARVAIPYPQVDVHFDPAVARAVAAASEG